MMLGILAALGFLCVSEALPELANLKQAQRTSAPSKNTSLN
jgi:hypothetical protein